MLKLLENIQNSQFIFKLNNNKNTRALQLFTKHCCITDKHVQKKNQKYSLQTIVPLYCSLVLFKRVVSSSSSFFPTFSNIVIVRNQKLYIYFRMDFDVTSERKNEKQPRENKNHFWEKFQSHRLCRSLLPLLFFHPFFSSIKYDVRFICTRDLQPFSMYFNME